MRMRRIVAITLIGHCAAIPSLGQDNVTASELRAKAVKYLLAAQQADGGWASETGPGVTALALRALLQEPGIDDSHEAVQRGVAWMLRSQREDGGIYSADGLLKNYESSVALAALAALPRDAHKARLQALQNFLIDNQWDEGEGKSRDDDFYGGAGYGKGKRPDLSNTQIMLEALHDSGLAKDHPVYQKALVFIQRSQMRGESNDRAFARGSTQGGFIYSPANNGESKAGELEFEGRKELRCYGSMTYAGYKSLLYCGLSASDPRVAAALEWIRRNWTLDRNPNMPDSQSGEGLYYYYLAFARALQAGGERIIKDSLGREHDWRGELIMKLAREQKSDGSWVNEQDRWMEGLPALTTAYALLALQATER